MPSKQYRIGAAVFKNQDRKNPTVMSGDALPNVPRAAGTCDVLLIAIQNSAGDVKELALWSEPDGTWSGVVSQFEKRPP